MASTVSSVVVIACPQCGTRYQVAPETLGKRGRKVTCAECSNVWQAKAIIPELDESDRLFGEDDEAELDAAFAAAEPARPERSAQTPIVPAPPANPGSGDAKQPAVREKGLTRAIKAFKAVITRPKSSPQIATESSEGNRQKEFTQRQDVQRRSSPLARMRRLIRVASVGVLFTLIVSGVTFRTEIVDQFPDLAGAYEAVGLGVNVVGLEFRDVTTLISLKGGTNVLRVDARIYSVGARRVQVPPISVMLLDAAGAPLYEWGVVPETRELQPGEVTDFTTQLSSPPAGVARIRLTFMDGKAPGALKKNR